MCGEKKGDFTKISSTAGSPPHVRGKVIGAVTMIR